MSVCNASKVTRRIIERDNGRPASAGRDLPSFLNLQGDPSFICLSSTRHDGVDSIMGNPQVEDSDKFEAAVSQEEARLGYLHPTPEEIPSCLTTFDDFLSCNSMPTGPLISVRSRNFDAIENQFSVLNSSRYTALARWRAARQNGTSSSSA
jgi:hypothetical protein